jgi:pimeloyl-ACP methyl ester carboxylesterase/DNA-binding CsgD family transcriptional regulator
MGEGPSTEKPDSVTPVRSLSAFYDALTSYAIDPSRWAELLTEFDQLSDHLQHWDPGELVAELSRAESLSWRIQQDGGELPSNTFAYLLIDCDDKVVSASSNLPHLGNYLSIGLEDELVFTSPESLDSLSKAKLRLQSSEHGHSLVSLVRPDRPRRRFGFLIGRDEFPQSLDRIAGSATLALFIAQEETSAKLHDVIQASFGLTAAETDVTLKLVQGMTLKESAAELGISVNTARNHLQAVFDKSGINRQSDLVLIITQLSVILTSTENDRDATISRDRSPAKSPPRHFIILADGRRVAYRTYGEPMGRPIVYLHETLGSSRLPPGTDEQARRRSLYIIAPERPGFGFSDVDPDFSFASVGDDLRCLLDHLRIQRCLLIGFLCGGAYALRFADACPERVERILLVAGRPPRPMRGRFKHLMPLYNKMVSQPWLMSSFFNILRNRMSTDMNAKLINSVYGTVPHDRDYLEKNPAMFDHIASYTLESMTVTAAGVASELKCFANAKDTGLSALTAPITAWHGAADNLSAMDDLKNYLVGMPVRWRVFEEAGSLIFLEHWEAILDEVASS